MSEDAAPNPGSILGGLLLLFALHAAAALVCCVLAVAGGQSPREGLLIMMFVGGVQIAYAAPAAIVLALRRRTRTLKGLLIGAGITFLVNATCAGIVLGSMR